MKCQFCSKSKVYEVTEIQNGEVKSVHLCETCFQNYISSKGTTDKLGKIQIPTVPDPHLAAFDPEIANKFVEDMMNFVETLVGQQGQLQKTNKKECPKCGMTLNDLVKNGKLGCDNCYDWYADELSHILQLSHGTPRKEELVHVGKVPKNFKKKNKEVALKETDKMLLTKLEYKLAVAVKQENYEQAAVLRDAISNLKAKMISSPKNEPDQSTPNPES